ncbi:MAG: hypothetical protein WD673_15220 [Alphaproteobacteria bacterium]
MAARLVIVLNDRWALLADPVQWVLARRNGRARARSTGYIARWFPTLKATLVRDLRENAIVATPEAEAFIAGLPERHADWWPSRFEGPANRELGRRGDDPIAPVGEGSIPAQPARGAPVATPCRGPLSQVP